MINTLYQIIRTIRPRQWLKNLAIFAAPILQGVVLKHDVLISCVLAFIAFTLLACGTYILNDLVDAPKDRKHPVKSNRPIASGKLSINLALILMAAFYFLGTLISFSFVGSYFGILGISYILLQLSYSFYLRNIIIMDAMAVSAGFILRVFAGGVASDTSISSWLVLTTIGLSLLLAFGKRRSEKTLLSEYEESETRTTLLHYPEALLDSMISMSASFCMIAYSVYAFQTSPVLMGPEISRLLPSILKSPKWMMITIPLVLYGVARYLYIIYEKKEGESPERVLLSDSPLLLTVLIWGVTVFIIRYSL
ncbi:decaprenyl-phosphate phosphoribosyltransferase [candidate division WWE3 bacterium]|nr:decaprenyl-phosphate phosphoribosyltransferase [candidate division WWE3 bacterium]